LTNGPGKVVYASEILDKILHGEDVEYDYVCRSSACHFCREADIRIRLSPFRHQNTSLTQLKGDPDQHRIVVACLTCQARVDMNDVCISDGSFHVPADQDVI
jgi:ferredoxin